MTISRNPRTFGALLALLALAPLALLAAQDPARDEPAEESLPDRVRLRIEVTGGKDEKVVADASVYVRYPEDGRSIRKKLVEMNLKTNAEGITRVPPIPRGKVLVQVVAPGWRTFGRWYDVEKAEETIKIRLKDPPRWY
jgi:hypothetical protein